MAIDASIPLGVRVPNIMGAAQQGMSLGRGLQEMRQRKQARQVQKEKTRKLESIQAEPMPNDPRAMHDRLMRIFQIDPQLAQAQAALYEKRQAQQQAQMERTRELIIPHSAEFSKFDEGQKAQYFVNWREMLRNHGAIIDPRWEKGYTPQIGKEIEMLGSVQAKKKEQDKYGLQPIYGTGSKGKPVAMRMGPEGLQQLKTPEGVELTPGVQKIDLGNRWAILDKGGNVLGYQKKTIKPGESPEFKAEVAGAVETAKTEAGITAGGKITPQEKKEKAKAQVSGTVNTMRDMYNKLRDLPGGVIDIKKSGFSNFLSRLSASGMGQAVQNALGTEVQSTRNAIKAMRPTLINYVRQATEMGAKGMDSEKELEFYLSAVSNPNRDFQSNMVALKVLDDAYGLGLIPEKIETIAPELAGKSREQITQYLKGGPVKKRSTRITPKAGKEVKNQKSREELLNEIYE